MVENYKITEENASGNCPECGYSWDGGDVLEVMKSRNPKLSGGDYLIGEAKKMYGWTPENPRRFSKLVTIEPSDGDYDFDGSNGFHQCPNCSVAWDTVTGERTEKYKQMLVNHDKMTKLIEELRKNRPNI